MNNFTSILGWSQGEFTRSISLNFEANYLWWKVPKLCFAIVLAYSWHYEIHVAVIPFLRLPPRDTISFSNSYFTNALTLNPIYMHNYTNCTAEETDGHFFCGKLKNMNSLIIRLGTGWCSKPWITKVDNLLVAITLGLCLQNDRVIAVKNADILFNSLKNYIINFLNTIIILYLIIYGIQFWVHSSFLHKFALTLQIIYTQRYTKCTGTRYVLKHIIKECKWILIMFD